MPIVVDASTLHRGAKYFMDSGRVQSHDEAMALLRQFGLTIFVGPGISNSTDQQVALLSLINAARRTFLAGVEVVGLPDVKSLTRLASRYLLKQAVVAYGGRVVSQPNPLWPSALIGECALPASRLPCWRLTWAGWRGGVIPARDNRCLQENEAIALAPMLAAAVCAAEAFAYHAGDHAMAGRRSLGLSLWKPSADWLTADATEPRLSWLPSRLWIIGLGNLGQAFAWALASLPYDIARDVQLVLQDYDRIAKSNDSTSVLSFVRDIGRRKARVVGKWLDTLGFETFLNESRFGPWTRRASDDPAVALCGVDNALARTALEQPGFGLVIEAGLGAGPESFRSLSLHTFPASRSPEEIWSKQVGVPNESVEAMPAYQAIKRQGVDECGLAQLASRTVGVPFVGLIAAVLVVSELLRRLHGGIGLELVSGSVAALRDIETVSTTQQSPYAFGHVVSEGAVSRPL
jgi:hypothetical protein